MNDGIDLTVAIHFSARTLHTRWNRTVRRPCWRLLPRKNAINLWVDLVGKISKYRRLHLAALLAIGFFILPNQLKAQSDIVEKDTNVSIDQHRLQSHPSQQLDRLNSQAYILGPGDALVIELLDVPEYSGIFTIGPDGTIYIPRLDPYVEVSQSRGAPFSSSNIVYLKPTGVCEPGRIPTNTCLHRGEVRRPGYYYLSDKQNVIGAENRDLANQCNQ